MTEGMYIDSQSLRKLSVNFKSLRHRGLKGQGRGDAPRS